MHIITDYKNIEIAANHYKNNVAILGNFDGIHKGHQYIIENALKIAAKKKLPLALVTFEPHPISLLKPTSKGFRLTDRDQKIAIAEEFGINVLFIINFTPQFANISAVEFLEDILVNKIKTSHIITGYDFAFGKDRKGDVKLISQYCSKNNLNFTKIEPVKNSNIIYSSGFIRKLISEGKVAKVPEFLGRNFAIKGKVESGKKLAKDLGFPTANININNYIAPLSAVYAVKVRLDNKIYKAIANIGCKPTINDDNKIILEVHIFDFNRDIYGKELTIEFIEFIREEKKFNNLEALKAQIAEDCIIARQIHG